MMRNNARITALLVAIAMGVAVLSSGVASAARPQQGNPHDDAATYWTADRVAKARPRELFVDEHGRISHSNSGEAAQGGKPTAKANGGSTSGASWTG
ncbi:MAG: hypothetical protein AB7F89_27750, partial [Pirellulaceae bacterium]